MDQRFGGGEGTFLEVDGKGSKDQLDQRFGGGEGFYWIRVVGVGPPSWKSMVRAQKTIKLMANKS